MEVLHFELADVLGEEDESPCFKLDEDERLCFVLGDEGERQPFMRLCLKLEKMVPDDQVWEKIKDLCVIATEKENRCFEFRDTWLKTTVTLKNADSLFRKQLTTEELRNSIRDPNSIRDLNRIKGSDSFGIEITQNVLPLEFYRRPHFTRVFYTRQIWKQSLTHRTSLQKIRAESYSRHALPSSLRPAESSPDAVVLREVPSEKIFELRHVMTGGQGSVFKVLWGNCTYALKSYCPEYKPYYTMDEKIATMRPMSQHPHIVQAFASSRWSTDETHPYCLLMEFLDRGDLGQVLAEAVRWEAPLSWLDKLDVLSQIASAMVKLHENNVVHGDLKPGNILMGDFEVSAGNVRHFLAKVADFGTAKIIDSRSEFEPNMGTTAYTSPEVLVRKHRAVRNLPNMVKCNVSEKLDVYSFGAMAYEILTECKPFGRRNLKDQEIIEIAEGEKRLIDSEEGKKVNGYGYSFRFYNYEVVPLVKKCLEWDPTKRPTFLQVCATLKRAHTRERRVLQLKSFMAGVIAILPVYIIYIFYFFVPCCL